MKLPRTLIAMLGLQVATIVLRLVYTMDPHDVAAFQRFSSIATGTTLAVHVLAIAGFLDLARRSPRPTGLRLAALGQVVGVWVQLGWIAVTYAVARMSGPGLFDTYRYLAVVAPIVTGVGIAIASRNAGLTAWVVVSTVLAALSSWLVKLAELGATTAAIALAAIMLAWSGALFATALDLARISAAPFARPEVAASGLRRAALSQWILLAATLAVVVTLLVAGHDGSGRSVEGLRIVGQLVVVGTLGVLAWGLVDAAGSDVADLPAWPLVVAAAAVLWCVGVEVQRVLALVVSFSTRDADVSERFSDATRIVAVMATAVGLLVLGPLRRARGARFDVAGLVYVALAGLGVASLVAEVTVPLGGLCMVVACVFASIGFSRGAEVVAAPALPTAVVRS